MITITLIYILLFTGPNDEQFLSLEDDSELSSANVSSESKSSASHEATKKHAVKDSSKKWPNAVVHIISTDQISVSVLTLIINELYGNVYTLFW